MKVKILFTVVFLSLGYATAFAQFSTIISNFKIAYVNGDIDNYIHESERIVDGLTQEEKNRGQRILELFKLLTGKQQYMSNTEFNKALSDVGIGTILEKNINNHLTLIYFNAGTKRTYMVLNQSSKSYKFELKGTYRSSKGNYSNSFDGGIFEHHVRLIQYTSTPYIYSIISVKEIPSIF